MIPDEATIARYAAQYGVPPAILYAVGMQTSGFSDSAIGASSGKVGVFGMSATQLQSVGIDPHEAAGNVDLQIQAAAQYLSSIYAQNGNWQSTLSQYAGGNATDWQSPTSPIGGIVNAMLGIAGANVQYGLNDIQSAIATGQYSVPASFFNSSTALGKALSKYTSLGGVITQNTLHQLSSAVSNIHTSSGSSDPIHGSSSANNYGFSLQTLPFDPNLIGIGHTSEEFGDTSGPGGFGERGNDIVMNSGSQVTSPVDGVIHFKNYGDTDTGLTAYITSPGIPGQIYIGHLSAGSVQDGAAVKAGQPIAASGGGPTDPNHGNSTGSHIEFGYIDNQGQVHDPRPLLVDAYRVQFATDVLKQAGLPITPRNVSVLKQMAIDEGMNLSSNNPLATTQGQGSDYNSVGVKNFGDYQTGVASTVATLQNGNFAGLVQGLQQNAAPSFYQSGAGAAALAKWQGGSAQDINAIAGMQDPGAAFGQTGQTAQASEPSPAQISQFAQEAQQFGLSPKDIAELTPSVSTLMQRLNGRPMTLSDLQGLPGMPQSEINRILSEKPSQYYPEITAGQFLAGWQQASLYSLPNQRRYPTIAEVGQMTSSGLKPSEVQSYYQNYGAGAPQDMTRQRGGQTNQQQYRSQPDQQAMQQAQNPPQQQSYGQQGSRTRWQ